MSMTLEEALQQDKDWQWMKHAKLRVLNWFGLGDQLSAAFPTEGDFLREFEDNSFCFELPRTDSDVQASLNYIRCWGFFALAIDKLMAYGLESFVGFDYPKSAELNSNGVYLLGHCSDKRRKIDFDVHLWLYLQPYSLKYEKLNSIQDFLRDGVVKLNIIADGKIPDHSFAKARDFFGKKNGWKAALDGLLDDFANVNRLW